MNKLLNFDTIVYHSPCSDGNTALWCACNYKDISEKIPSKAGVAPSIDYNNKNVLFVDLCPKIATLNEICKSAKNVVVLDHHKSSLDDFEVNKDICPNNLHIILDMAKSGCQITWNYFFEDKPKPWFVDYVADRDLWKWQLPNSKAINQVLFENNMLDAYDLDAISSIVNYSEKQIDELVKEGNLLLKIQKKQLDLSISRAIEVSMPVGNTIYNVWLGNITYGDRSEFGNLLANKPMSNGSLPDFSATWIYEPKLNEWWISLRGHKNSPDLSAIAGFFGGGGHQKASGFTIKTPRVLCDVFIIKQ